MATIAAVHVQRDDLSEVVTWTDLVNATSDVGNKVAIPQCRDISVQAFGTNATTVVIQGSNDGTNWNNLGSGLTLTIGATGSSPVTRVPEHPLFIRPSTPSAGVNTDVVLVATGCR